MVRRTSSQRRRKNARTSVSRTHRLRNCLIILISLPALVFIVGAIGYSYMFSWLQGDGFRHFFSQTLRKTTGAQQVNIPQNLTVVDSNMLKLPLIELKGMGAVSEMSVRDLHARPERSALWKRILRFSQFSSDELSVTLNFGNSHQSSPRRDSSSATISEKKEHPVSPAKSNGGGFFKSIQMHSFIAHYANTNFHTPTGEFRLQGYKLTVSPHPHSSRRVWNIRMENGRVTTPSPLLPQCGLKNAELLVGSDPYVLRSCCFLLSPGELYATGNYSRSSGLWEAQLELQNVDASKLLSGEWQRRISGSLNGEFSLSGQGKTGDWEASGKLWAKDASLSDLPLLSSLRLPGNSPYKKIELEKATCNLKFPHADPQHNIERAVLWDNIDIRAKGNMLRLTGRIITGTDGSLSGSLRLGIPGNILTVLGIPGSSLTDRIFSRNSDAPDFVWLTINLSGTLKEPHEDLSARLSALLSQKPAEIPAQALDALRGLISPAAPPQQPSNATDKDEEQDEKDESTPPQKTPTRSARDLIHSGLDILL